MLLLRGCRGLAACGTRGRSLWPRARRRNPETRQQQPASRTGPASPNSRWKLHRQHLTSTTFPDLCKKTKGPTGPGTVIIAHQGVRRQFRSGQFRLRKCTRDKDGSVLPRRSALPDQEHHVLAALQARFHFREFVLVVDSLLVDFQDDVTAPQADILGE